MRKFLNELTASHGVSFATIRNEFGNSITPVNVYVSTATNRVGTIVGTPCTGCIDDGRYAYEIAFTQPQRWAGVERQWNSSTITRFFNPAENLLAEVGGTMFIGFVADTDTADNWVQRIEVDGTGPFGQLQVGYTDDLFFGTAAVPEPATSAWVLGSAIGLLALTRGKCISRGAESR